MMAPSYFKPNNPQHLAEILIEVAKEVPEIPVYYYHIPFMNQINVKK